MSHLIASSPHFFVSDLKAAVAYYTDVLGFECPQLWGEPPSFAMPSRDGFIVMLNQAEGGDVQPNGAKDCWDAYFWCQGVDALFKEFQAKGAEIVHPPTNRDLYGMREFAIRDRDGYMLAFAEDLDSI